MGGQADEKLKVLLVDDDRRMVKTLRDILTIKGHGTLTAYSGEEALEKIASEKPGCVLMDVRMPGMSGIEILRAIKELSPELPVLLMSAYATDEQVEEAKRLGAYALMSKPLDMQMVLSFLSLLRKEESILVVDDDPHFCRTLKDILQLKGYRVLTEADPGKVLGHMEESYQLVVVLDVNLGATSGVDVLKDVRAKYPTKPVVLVTGYRDEMTDSINKGMEIGAYTCLYKPVPTDELIGCIEEISRKKMRAVLGEPFEK